MEINKQQILGGFQVIEDKTGWKDRNALLRACFQELGLPKGSYWMLRSKTNHLSMGRLSWLLDYSKGDPKIFFGKAKQLKQVWTNI